MFTSRAKGGVYQTGYALDAPNTSLKTPVPLGLDISQVIHDYRFEEGDDLLVVSYVTFVDSNGDDVGESEPMSEQTIPKEDLKDYANFLRCVADMIDARNNK